MNSGLCCWTSESDHIEVQTWDHETDAQLRLVSETPLHPLEGEQILTGPQSRPGSDLSSQAGGEAGWVDNYLGEMEYIHLPQILWQWIAWVGSVGGNPPCPRLRSEASAWRSATGERWPFQLHDNLQFFPIGAGGHRVGPSVDERGTLHSGCSSVDVKHSDGYPLYFLQKNLFERLLISSQQEVMLQNPGCGAADLLASKDQMVAIFSQSTTTKLTLITAYRQKKSNLSFL